MAAENVPEEILSKIFVRLPTKSLLRFRWVSKPWNLLISDSSNMKSRLRRMILLPTLPFHAINYVDGSIVKLDSPFEKFEGKEVIIVGTFNGVVFLVLRDPGYISKVRDMMILYNPFTRAFKVLPNPPSPDNIRYVYGFGYGTSLDDLKIVRLQMNCTKHFLRPWHVFDVKKWSWGKQKMMRGDYMLNYQYAGTFVNGFLYWYAYQERYTPVILSLDVKEMKFSTIRFNRRMYGIQRMGTFMERLCIVAGFELWVMNKHDSRESWSEVCSLKLLINIKQEPLTFLDEGKLVMLKKPNQLIIYDMLKDSYEELNVLTSRGEVWGTQAVEYEESLISPSKLCSSLI